MKSRIIHIFPAVTIGLLLMGGLQDPGGGAGLCFLVASEAGGCVEENIPGPPMWCGGELWYQWVVYPTSEQVCTEDFVGDGKTACDPNGGKEFHPQRQLYQCNEGIIVVLHQVDHPEVTCNHAAYPEEAEACQQGGG